LTQCRDSIIIWKNGDNWILDGHNRYDICNKHNIEFNINEKQFENEEEAKIFIINNQLARRNITDFVKCELQLKKKEFLLQIGKEKEHIRKTTLSINDKVPLPEHNTRNTLAKEVDISTGKFAQAEIIIKKAPENIKEKLRQGELSINQAYNIIKENNKQEQLKTKKEIFINSYNSEIINKPIIKNCSAKDFLNEFNDNSIDLLFTDPPYITEIEDINLFLNDWLPLVIKKTKHNGRLLICTGAYPKEIFAYLKIFLSQNKFIIDNPLIWTYKNTLGITPKMKYNLNYQIIWHLYSENSFPLDNSITNEMFSVIEINAPDGRQGTRLHTWQKPDELANRLIRHTTKENDLIVDCFCGTGTFLIAAARQKRIAKGCDISIENINIAKERGC
jgi:DNA modification methylase